MDIQTLNFMQRQYWNRRWMAFLSFQFDILFLILFAYLNWWVVFWGFMIFAIVSILMLVPEALGTEKAMLRYIEREE